MSQNFLHRANDLFEFSQSTRRDLHRHPEIGFQEFRTAGIVARELSSLGLEVTSGLAKTGVVGLLEGRLPGPVVMLRFDMDALPIQEETGAEYASETAGLMHACGHDAHVSIGLTVARLLAGIREELPGTVKLVFQPAEEGLGGAEGMIQAGVLENPRPVRCLGLHIWNEKPIGWAAVTPGPFMAGADTFWVQITGKGGHGAMPQSTVDPVVATAQWILAVQSIVARNVAPLQSAVVSVTTVHGGDAFNVIPQSVVLQGTIRAFEPAVRRLIHERFNSLLEGICGSMGCTTEAKITSITPAVINDPDTTRRVAAAVRQVVPEIELVENYQTMGSEDMAFFMNEMPGCFFMVGSANEERGLNYGHHHPRFDFDEQVLPRASALMAQAALQLLSEE